jgi:hypothetical protein
MGKLQDQTDLTAVSAQIKAITGENYHLYTSVRHDGHPIVVFTDDVALGYKAGLAHARKRLIELERRLALPLEQFADALGTRAYNALARAEYATLQQVAAASDAELLERCYSIGEKSMATIRRVVADGAQEGREASMDNAKTVEQYADEIMAMVLEDMNEDSAMRDARNFSDLHDWCDANEYMINADVPYDPGNEPVMSFYVDVQDAVTRRLEGQWQARMIAQASSVATTVVATLDLSDEATRTMFEQALRALVTEHKLNLLPCGWAPDPDSILDATPDASRIIVLDMNPGL